MLYARPKSSLWRLWSGKMNHKRNSLKTALCFFLLFVIIETPVFALNSEMDTLPMEQTRVEKIWKNVQMRKVEPSEEVLSPIISFDVSPNGDVAIGLKENEIRIFDRDNELVSCLKFINDGSYYIRWNEANLVIFYVRGSLLLEVTSSGDFVRMCEIDEQSLSTAKAWQQVRQNQPKTINGCTYAAKNNMGAFYNAFSGGSYSFLEKTDVNGETTLLYDVNTPLLKKKIFVTILFLTGFGIVAASFIRSIFMSPRNPSEK